MANVVMDNDYLANLLAERLKSFFDVDGEVLELYREFWKDWAENGCFDGVNFDVMVIADNTYVNDTAVIKVSEKCFNAKALAKEFLGAYPDLDKERRKEVRILCNRFAESMKKYNDGDYQPLFKNGDWWLFSASEYFPDEDELNELESAEFEDLGLKDFFSDLIERYN